MFSLIAIYNYQALSLGYLPQTLASADNTNFGLDNYRYHAQPHPIIVNWPTHELKCSVWLATFKPVSKIFMP